MAVETSTSVSYLNFQVSDEMIERFHTDDPFNHIVIDNALSPAIAEAIESELRSISQETWDANQDFTAKEMVQQKKKMGINDPQLLPQTTRSFMEFMNSPEFLAELVKLTKIPAIRGDPTFLGGGVHRINKGGKLSIHVDYNLHLHTRKHRRVNVLVYFNKNYDPSYGGALELWKSDMSQCAKSVDPIHNRMVIFRITDDAPHGHPEPWTSDDPRFSLAFYYFTDDRPEEEKSEFHWAVWKQRPGKGW